MMCDCSCSDFDGPSVFKTTWPKARKLRKCCECGDAIQPGIKYERATGMWDFGWDTFATCSICVKIRDRYCPGGYVIGELRTQIEDCLGFDYCEVPEEYDD